ncbi:MAG: hypothetical protein AAGK02_02680 [Pseudomonadota bacterium]
MTKSAMDATPVCKARNQLGTDWRQPEAMAQAFGLQDAVDIRDGVGIIWAVPLLS